MKGHFGRSPGLNELSGTLSRDTGHQQMRTPSCRRFLHTLSVFLSVHFFQDKHFAKSLFLDSKISDPFFLSLVSKRPNNSSTKVIFHFFCSLLREGACHLPIVNNMVISVWAAHCEQWEETHRCASWMQLLSVTERPYGRPLFFFPVDVIRLVNPKVIGFKDCPIIYLILIDHKELNMLNLRSLLYVLLVWSRKTSSCEIFIWDCFHQNSFLAEASYS